MKEFKDNCHRCAKAWNCYSRDNCQFEEMDISALSKEDYDENDAYLAYVSSLLSDDYCIDDFVVDTI